MTDRASILAQAEASRLGVLEANWVRALQALNAGADPAQAGALAKAEAQARAALEAARAASTQPPAPGTPPEPETTFPTLDRAVAYLRQHGHKAGKSKLAEDTKAGLIARTADGAYSQHALDKYGAAHCKPLVGAERRDERIEKLAERKLSAETQLAETRSRLASREEQIKNRELIPAAEAFRLMASLFAGIRADAENSIRGRAPESVHLCGGDSERTPEVIDLWLTEHAAWMQRFFRAWQQNQPMLVPRAAVVAAVRELAAAVGVGER